MLLPKTHVEAPVILAGILFKLGGYGLIRVLPLFGEVNKNLRWMWLRIKLVGGVMVSLMYLRQVDPKALIAFSSVAHIGLMLSGLLVFG